MPISEIPKSSNNSLVASLILFLCFLLLVHSYLSRNRSKHLKNVHRVLFVTAHPDDECLFFAPSILGLTSQPNCDVYLLCLSSGDYRKGQGSQRKLELRSAASCLGISQSNVILIEHTRLPDDPNVQWSKQLLADILIRWIESLDIDTLLTFDQDGISRHPNHCALFSAVQQLYSLGKMPTDTQVLVLNSVGHLRKYSAFLDLWPTYVSCTFVYVSSWSSYWSSLKAMRAHWSQLVWFRFLYVFFSRYMLVNSWRRIAMDRGFYK